MRTQRQGHIFSGAPERIASLRGACLIRDRYRCVVSRKFDKAEALRRYRQHDEPEPRDQDGAPLKGQSFAYLEVAHILPHSLIRLSSSGELVRVVEPGICRLLISSIESLKSSCADHT